ncbi:MAG: hypothetical protein H0X34_19640 [Chthoniobacterales bacterium]|nr:hypothetical protein [Chthoniobacterales bacterium]
MWTVLITAFSSGDFWKFTVPLLGAVIAWFANERSKRLAEQYERKEANYRELLRTLRGFYAGAQDADRLKSEFLDQLNLCWLYCPDDVIKKGYVFLDTVHAQQPQSDKIKEAALGALVSSIRADALSRKLVRRTSLEASDFKHFRTT